MPEKRGESHTPISRLLRYDHKKEPGAFNVCRRCGREHDLKKDMQEAKSYPEGE